MAAEFWFNDGGTPRKAVELYFNDGTAVRKVKEAWYNDGVGVRQVYSGFTIQNPLTGGTFTDIDTVPGAAACTISVNGDGSISLSGAANGSLGSQFWGSPPTAGVGAAYWVRVSLTSGTFSSSAGAGWLQLSTDRNWTRNRPISSAGLTSCTCTVEIASDSGGVTIVTSGSFTLRASHV